MKNTYEKVIEEIPKIYPGDQQHIRNGNSYVIIFLKQEEEHCRKRYNGKESRFDIVSVKDSLKFLLRHKDSIGFCSNDINILDEHTKKHIARICNMMIEFMVHDPEYFENDLLKKERKDD